MSAALNTVRWALRPEAQVDRSVTHVLLYPAVEILVLAEVVEKATNELDPFERAVYGACAAGVREIREQARTLDLADAFVAYLQDRLRTQGLIDDRGKPCGSESLVERARERKSLNLYWDPFVHRLWPRFIASPAPSATVSTRERRHFLEAGNDGDPYTINAFRIESTPSSRPSVDVEECLRAIEAWNRELRRTNQHSRVARTPAVTVLERQEPVWLCVPVHRVTRRTARFEDPFGGPLWTHMVRNLERLSLTNAGLKKWTLMSDPPLAESAETPSAANPEGELARELELLKEIVRSRPVAASLKQARFDLSDLAHRLIDVVERRGVNPLSAKPPTVVGYREKAAIMFGFDLDVDTLIPVSTNDDDLPSRVFSLLDRFQPSVVGPLHQIGAAHPGLLQLLLSPDAAYSVESLVEVCEAFAERRDTGSYPRSEEGLGFEIDVEQRSSDAEEAV